MYVHRRHLKTEINCSYRCIMCKFVRWSLDITAGPAVVWIELNLFKRVKVPSCNLFGGASSFVLHFILMEIKKHRWHWSSRTNRRRPTSRRPLWASEKDGTKYKISGGYFYKLTNSSTFFWLVSAVTTWGLIPRIRSKTVPKTANNAYHTECSFQAPSPSHPVPFYTFQWHWAKAQPRESFYIWRT